MASTGQAAGGHAAIGAAAERRWRLGGGACEARARGGSGLEGVGLQQGGRAHSLAGDIASLLVDRAGALETAAALVDLTPESFEVSSAAALPGAVSSHVACAKVLTVARALPCRGGAGEEVPQVPLSPLELVCLCVCGGAGASWVS